MKRCDWVKPMLIAQVKFTDWTYDDQLRQRVFLGPRTDEPAKGSFANKSSSRLHRNPYETSLRLLERARTLLSLFDIGIARESR